MASSHHQHQTRTDDQGVGKILRRDEDAADVCVCVRCVCVCVCNDAIGAPRVNITSCREGGVLSTKSRIRFQIANRFFTYVKLKKMAEVTRGKREWA